jgi:hypothetical protein
LSYPWFTISAKNIQKKKSRLREFHIAEFQSTAKPRRRIYERSSIHYIDVRRIFLYDAGWLCYVDRKFYQQLGRTNKRRRDSKYGDGCIRGGFLIFIASIIAIIGGSLALKRRTFGWKNLLAACLICYFVGSETTFQDGHVWSVVYLTAAFFALLSAQKPINLLQSSNGQTIRKSTQNNDDILGKTNSGGDESGIL